MSPTDELRTPTLSDLSAVREYVASSVRPLSPTTTPLHQTLGLVLAERVVAREDVPRFENSSVDGFALRAEDTQGGSASLRVTGTILAGSNVHPTVEPGSATKIMTGAPLPPGADAVCMIEDCVVEGDHVTITRSFRPGDYVRHAGDDTRAGEVLFEVGTVVNGAALGVLVGQGIESLSVIPRPRVGILSTGNEVVDSKSVPGEGQIRDLNRPMLLALVEDAGCVGVDLGVARDSREAVTETLQRAVEECDVVVSSGGVSVGDVDFVKIVLADLAPDTARSLRVAMKPGKPFAFAVVGPRNVPVFGLPGNPVSARVSFEVFVRPSLRRRAGHSVIHRMMVDAVLDQALERELDGKIHFLHVTVQCDGDGFLHVRNIARRDSHLLHAVSTSNGLAVIPMVERLEAGATVKVMVLDPESLGEEP